MSFKPYNGNTTFTTSVVSILLRRPCPPRHSMSMYGVTPTVPQTITRFVYYSLITNTSRFGPLLSSSSVSIYSPMSPGCINSFFHDFQMNCNERTQQSIKQFICPYLRSLGAPSLSVSSYRGRTDSPRAARGRS